MKIAVLGLGVIGTLYGWALSKENQVDHLVRPEKLKHLFGKIIDIDVIDERESDDNQQKVDSYDPHIITSVDDSYDWVIVPVSTLQLSDALEMLNKQAKDTKYIIMTLNWDGTDQIERIIKPDQYILGYAGGGGTIQHNDRNDKNDCNNKNDKLWGNIGADIMLGTVNGKQKDILNDAVKMFQNIGIEPEIPSNVLHSLWMHNVDSAALGVGLNKYKDLHKFLEDKPLVHTCFKAMQEGFKVCGKRGIQLDDYPEVAMYDMPFEQLYPMFKNNFEQNPIMQRYTAHAIKAIPEMVDNFIRIYRTAKEQNTQTPAMDELYKFVMSDNQTAKNV